MGQTHLQRSPCFTTLVLSTRLKRPLLWVPLVAGLKPIVKGRWFIIYQRRTKIKPFAGSRWAGVEQNQSIYLDTQVWRESGANPSFLPGPETWRNRVSGNAEDGGGEGGTSHQGLPCSILHLPYATSIPF